MTWSGWDVWVIAAGVAQVAGLGGVVYAALKIIKGPVSQVQKRVVPLIGGGKALVVTGKAAWEANREQGILLFDSVKEAAHSVHGAAHMPAFSLDAPVNYQKVSRVVSGVKVAQQGIGLVRRFTQKSRPPKVRRASLAERMGFVPPAGKPVGKVLGWVRTVLRVRGLLKGTGLVPK